MQSVSKLWALWEACLASVVEQPSLGAIPQGSDHAKASGNTRRSKEDQGLLPVPSKQSWEQCVEALPCVGGEVLESPCQI